MTDNTGDRFQRIGRDYHGEIFGTKLKIEGISERDLERTREIAGGNRPDDSLGTDDAWLLEIGAYDLQLVKDETSRVVVKHNGWNYGSVSSGDRLNIDRNRRLTIVAGMVGNKIRPGSVPEDHGPVRRRLGGDVRCWNLYPPRPSNRRLDRFCR